MRREDNDLVVIEILAPHVPLCGIFAEQHHAVALAKVRPYRPKLFLRIRQCRQTSYSLDPRCSPRGIDRTGIPDASHVGSAIESWITNPHKRLPVSGER